MAKHFQNVHNRSNGWGFRNNEKEYSGGDRLKLLLQRETFYIYELQATVYPGLNLEIGAVSRTDIKPSPRIKWPFKPD